MTLIQNKSGRWFQGSAVGQPHSRIFRVPFLWMKLVIILWPVESRHCDVVRELASDAACR